MLDAVTALPASDPGDGDRASDLPHRPYGSLPGPDKEPYGTSADTSARTSTSPPGNGPDSADQRPRTRGRRPLGAVGTGGHGSAETARGPPGTGPGRVGAG